MAIKSLGAATDMESKATGISKVRIADVFWRQYGRKPLRGFRNRRPTHVSRNVRGRRNQHRFQRFVFGQLFSVPALNWDAWISLPPLPDFKIATSAAVIQSRILAAHLTTVSSVDAMAITQHFRPRSSVLLSPLLRLALQPTAPMAWATAIGFQNQSRELVIPRRRRMIETPVCRNWQRPTKAIIPDIASIRQR